MEKTIQCPKCKEDMVKLTKGNHIIDKCQKCEGIFLDKEEIETINKAGFIKYIIDYFRRD